MNLPSGAERLRRVARQNSLSAPHPREPFNYRTEPFFYRFGSRLDGGLWVPVPTNPPADWTNLSPTDLSNITNLSGTGTDTRLSVSNELVGGDPQTPVFRAPAGMPVRFRLLDPGGIGDNQQVFELTGHVWPEEPYTQNSTAIGHNPKSNWTGTTPAYGTTSHYDVVIAHAGGARSVAGDYLYRSWTANQFQVGMWGLFRVALAECVGTCAATPETCPDTVTISSVQPTADGGYTVQGVKPSSRRPQFSAPSPSRRGRAAPRRQALTTRREDGLTRREGLCPIINVRSAHGGVAQYRATHRAAAAITTGRCRHPPTPDRRRPCPGANARATEHLHHDLPPHKEPMR